jgi:hypothetical protein
MPFIFDKEACDRVLFRDEHRERKEWRPGYCSICKVKDRLNCPNFKKQFAPEIRKEEERSARFDERREMVAHTKEGGE